MKIIGTLIVCCLMVIAFNFVAALNGSTNDNYNPAHAERMAQFAIILVPLSVAFFIAWLVKLVAKKIKG